MSSNNKTTTMKEAAKPALVPKLRFPEFVGRGNWEQKHIEDFFNVGSSKRVLQQDWVAQGIPFYRTRELVSLSKNEPFSSEIFISKPLFEEITQKYGAPREGDFLISGVGTLGISYLVKKGDKFYFKDGNVILFSRKGGISSLFFKYCFESDVIQDQILKQASVSTVGTYTIQNAKVTKFYCPPTEAEQQKIAVCLSSADDLIAAQARKVDALKIHKRGLMQQLFPREGETQPRLRFSEFQNVGKWGVKAIGDVFRVTRGEVLAMTVVKDVASDEAPFPVYSSQTKNNGLAGFHSEYLYEDAITWTTDGANAGDVNFRPGKFYCTNVCGVLINTKGYANACVAALLNSVTRSHVSYVGNPKLMNGVMAKIEIPLPSVPEQERIASFLSSLDALITVEAQKLEALKTHKKGLMQQLFPSVEKISQ